MNKITCFLLSLSFCVSFSVNAGSVNFDLSAYKSQPGLNATVKDDILTVIWMGDPGNEVRIRFGIEAKNPVIKELALRNSDDFWRILATDVIPEFRIVSGIRRVTQQQTEPLEELGILLTEEKLNEIKWDAFWDAPLYIDDKPPLSHKSSIPASDPFANHPGMPRKPEEINRSVALYNVSEARVTTNGSRIEIVFQGVEAGIFKGYLQFDVFKGSNLIRQMLVAKTNHPSAAFKYDAGLKGIRVPNPGQLAWFDLAGNWQNYRFGGLVNEKPVVLKSKYRLVQAELENGTIAAFPPPHSFYWARESEENLGYSWYRQDSDKSFSFGVRQAETEENPEFYHNFALYSARPDTWQRMPVFLYISHDSGKDAMDGVLDFTHGDRFKPLPGYKIMGHHYHVDLVERLNAGANEIVRLNDVETMKSVGVDIYSVIDGVRGSARHDRGEAYLDALAEYYDAARLLSDDGFLLMPSDENSTGGRPPFLGGHYDLIPSKPVFWRPGRTDDQPVFEPHPKYGTVYNLGSPADMMIMAERENVLISLPHPNTKGSTGYPEAFKDEPHFLHENYFSLGYRWGMGIDASGIRLGEYRFLSLWDKTNNWMAKRNLPPKFALAISEARSDKGYRGRPPTDDAYGMSPVNYLKIDKVPSVDDMSPVTKALQKGNYFVTSGEVLIPDYEIRRDGNKLSIVAQVEWTFPLQFVEVVWGDGETTGRQIISTTELLPFGKKRFEIPFDATGKKWVRFAAWDVATNGAMVQPVSLIEQ